MGRGVAKYAGVTCGGYADSNVLTSILTPLQTRLDLVGRKLRPVLVPAAVGRAFSSSTSCHTHTDLAFTTSQGASIQHCQHTSQLFSLLERITWQLHEIIGRIKMVGRGKFLGGSSFDCRWSRTWVTVENV